MAAPPKKILFLSNAEFGELTVVLATCDALMHAAPAVQLHVATYGGQPERAVAATSDYARRTSPAAAPIVFHQVSGPSYVDEIFRRFGSIPPSFGLPPSFWNTLKFIGDMPYALLPWGPDEFVVSLDSCLRIIDEVKPDLIGVNSLFAPGLTAARHVGAHFIVLAPGSIKDYALSKQPRGGAFWKYPIAGTAFACPVPWHQKPMNVCFMIFIVYILVTNKHLKSTASAIKAKNNAELVTIGSLAFGSSDCKLLVSGSAELDFPMMVPDFLVPCGPIVRPVPSVADVDPDLDAWLASGPVVYISLGTHALTTEDLAVEMAKAVRVLLDSAESSEVKSDLRVLWKLKKKGSYNANSPGSKVHAILGKEMASDRIRIVDWVTAEPMAILQSGHVVCSVNHGGANSFYESVTTGTPQVVLPQWADCYEYAYRAEMLGIGRWGSKSMKPQWSAEELGPTLIEVVIGKRRDAYRRTAQRLSERFGVSAGRAKAAKIILESMGSST
ncbi:hypothetical protein GGTG_03769 [Gaeumannomyces tritici R3-111a-1]|uniref:Erythromycin biosynthesis protein CIII-like C-terminal domain-containing protein n=1 Tax=Gaeumannomyces tritici (strain R3-111a-1) TaxID=644352 RepID=J3NR64_GAET3|nr:hypothetical protein GGTG_03769 [Gaeumannomyces tritici R3-111a-1]EJT78670.1 hypothetical protein GGTG_03769 [Gaeumannomyces tritici R3-111a-1]